MRISFCFVSFLIALLSVFPLVSVAAVPLPQLARPPLGDRWFGVTTNGERTGFAHQKISEAADGYEIYSEGSVKMVVLGFSREQSSRERYSVNRDLTLRTFDVEQTIDGKPVRLSGEATAKGVRVIVDSGGARKEKFLKTKGAVYPPPAMNLYPMMAKGAAPGKSYRVQMFDIEAVKVKDVKISVRGLEALAGSAAVHLQNDLYTFVDNDIWVNLAGETVKESVRDGLVEIAAEDEQSFRMFIADAALSRRELILDFSLVRVTPPLGDPAGLKRLVLEVDGIPSAMTLLQGGGQSTRRLADGKVIFTGEMPPAACEPNGLSSGQSAQRENLESNDRLPASHPEIVARKDEVAGGEKDPRKLADKLARWVATSVENADSGNGALLDTLKAKRGNSLSRACLYVSLARAAGIPSRVVSGLAHVEGKGFLYHSWAESLVDGNWVQVDPTFGQMPADVAHIKLVEGENPGDIAALAGVVGKIRARVVEKQ